MSRWMVWLAVLGAGLLLGLLVRSSKASDDPPVVCPGATRPPIVLCPLGRPWILQRVDKRNKDGVITSCRWVLTCLEPAKEVRTGG